MLSAALLGGTPAAKEPPAVVAKLTKLNEMIHLRRLMAGPPPMMLPDTISGACKTAVN